MPQVVEAQILEPQRTYERPELLPETPKVAMLVVWPRAILPTPVRPPSPAWPWEALHILAAIAFWVVIGFWTYRRHDFGSRSPTK